MGMGSMTSSLVHRMQIRTGLAMLAKAMLSTEVARGSCPASIFQHLMGPTVFALEASVRATVAVILSLLPEM